MQLLLWMMVTVGHIGWWCAVFNRTHATAWPRGWRKLIEYAAIVVTGAPLLLVPVVLWRAGISTAGELGDTWPWLRPYLVFCSIVACIFTAGWIGRKLFERRPARVRRTGQSYLRVEQLAGQSLVEGWFARLFRWFPGNQFTHLAVERFEVRIDGQRPAGGVEASVKNAASGQGGSLVPKEDGAAVRLRIAQLSDLHFTGQLRPGFFHEVVKQGDIADEWKCLDWIGTVLGPLEAGLGKYYVLGNHDRRIGDESALRGKLREAGFEAASGRWADLSWNGWTIRLTGNELPWYRAARTLGPEPASGKGPLLKLLLSHSPDQFNWAVARKFDLVFAGHTHGGQIRLPLIGPIIAPSRQGVRLAGGDFERDGVLMHVSRGLSSDDPVRWNCPPELGLFEVLLSGDSR
jgi:uncharacterized protein